MKKEGLLCKKDDFLLLNLKKNSKQKGSDGLVRYIEV